MGKGNRGKRGGGGDETIRTLVPNTTEVMVAWANLLNAMVGTMYAEGVGADVIHRFLATLDTANRVTFHGDMLDFVLFITDELRRGVPSND